MGSVFRFLLSTLVTRHNPTLFPWGTLAVNLCGCLLLGVLAGLFDRYQVTNLAWRLFFIVGLCGGFTTFSTFSSESLFLFRNGLFGWFVLYAGVSFFAGLLLTYAGFQLVAGK